MVRGQWNLALPNSAVRCRQNVIQLENERTSVCARRRWSAPSTSRERSSVITLPTSSRAYPKPRPGLLPPHRAPEKRFCTLAPESSPMLDSIGDSSSSTASIVTPRTCVLHSRQHNAMHGGIHAPAVSSAHLGIASSLTVSPAPDPWSGVHSSSGRYPVDILYAPEAHHRSRAKSERKGRQMTDRAAHAQT
jgi:hypothetical protein